MALQLKVTTLIVVLAGLVAQARVQRELWVASAGFGLCIGALGDTQVLLTTQLENVRTPRIFFGPLIQAAIASSSIFGASGTVRYLVGNHAKIRPSFEAGLGMAFATASIATSSVGVLINMGMGVDYQVDSDLSVGTIFRANLAPPIDNFFLSWPLVIVRLSI